MHLEILVEEPSAEAALEHLLPAILQGKASYRIHVFQGKHKLLATLCQRLRGYRPWLPQDWRIVVLVDEDRQDCRKLKAELEMAAKKAKLFTKSSPNGKGRFQVVNRIAVEELEAWFFGDIQALRRVYPRLPRTLDKRRNLRDPDAIPGGTSECLARLLRRNGYFPAGMPKVEVARQVSRHMDPDRNTSRSYQVFRQGVLACL